MSIQPPIRGEWKVIHNPGDTPHARDLIGLRAGKRLPYPLQSLPLHVLYRISATTAFGWNRAVHAPFDGEVIESSDGYPDIIEMNLIRDVLQNVIFLPGLDTDIQRFAGNYVVIEGTDGVAFMAHLQCDSVTVDADDYVTEGEQIGRIGNAGASLIPHLHFQLLSEWPLCVSNIAEKDRPFCFHQYELQEDGTWRTVENRAPKSGDRIHVTAE